MKIIWARHGQTNGNKEGRYIGFTNQPLNKVGMDQAKVLSEELKEEKIDIIYASDLTRADETAKITADMFNMKVTIDARLRELNFGAWEDKTYDEIMSLEPTLVTKWIQDPYHISPPGGESLQTLGDRVDSFLEDVKQKHARTILIVTHGGPLRWVQSKWIKQDHNLFWEVDGVKHGEYMIMDVKEVLKCNHS